MAIEFEKYKNTERGVGFISTHARARLGDQRFEQFLEELRHRAIPFTSQGGTERADTIAIDYRQDTGMGLVVTGLLLEHVYGRQIRRDCEALYKYVLVRQVSRLTGFEDSAF